jgi:acetyl-CoA synthetase
MKGAHVSGMAAYQALCDKAEADYEGYWAGLAREFVSWKTPFTKVLDESQAPFFKWFEDGTLNVSYNCLDRNVEAGKGDKVAIIFEADDGKVTKVTYKQLLAHLPACQRPEVAGHQEGRPRRHLHVDVASKAWPRCRPARASAPSTRWCSAASRRSRVRDRVQDAGAVAIITADEQARRQAAAAEGHRRRGHRAGRLRDGEERGRLPAHRRQDRLGAPRDRWLHELMASQPTTCEPEWVEAEHPLFLLYTSGSTGKPKGVQHSTGGYLLHAALTTKWTFDLKDDDVFWCTADIGWVTGHTYITYGPLALGATEIVFEGVPTYPDAGRFWKMIQTTRSASSTPRRRRSAR